MSYLLKEISDSLKIPEAIVDYIMKTAPRRYKVFEIPKRSGRGTRTIAQPAKEVKLIQRWIMCNILSLFPIHDAATGYIKGRGIKYNAKQHERGHFLLKIDFKDFFPSIKPKDFKKIFKHNASAFDNKYSEDDVNLLLKCLFWNNKKTSDIQLSIGAPSSPMLSNIIMYEYDVKIKSICDKYDAMYTRYADDIAISCSKENILRKIEQEIKRITEKIKTPLLIVNDRKTIHTSKKHNRHITGIVISNNNKISLGCSRKKEIKSMIYNYKNNNDLSNKSILRGYLSFIRDIEPDFYELLKRKYGEDFIKSIYN